MSKAELDATTRAAALSGTISLRKSSFPLDAGIAFPYATGCRQCGGFRENAMHNASILSALILMLSFIGPAAQAQIAPQQTPSQDVLAPAPKLNLTLEQRHTIKEFVKDMKADVADVQATVGEPIPPGINPRPMPSDVGQRVPQVKTHRFFLTAQQIVIVDPKDNKVADVIKLAD
jgi:hypothetical protein